MIKVIFLDIDGVLVNSKSPTLPRIENLPAPDPVCVQALNRIVAATEAKIVISSSWRKGKHREDMECTFVHWNVPGEIIGITPGRLNQHRGTEIQAWLDFRKELFNDVESFVILDDDTDMLHLTTRLVRTSFSQGLTEKHADLAIEMLSRPWVR